MLHFVLAYTRIIFLCCNSVFPTTDTIYYRYSTNVIRSTNDLIAHFLRENKIRQKYKIIKEMQRSQKQSAILNCPLRHVYNRLLNIETFVIVIEKGGIHLRIILQPYSVSFR